MLFFLSSSLSRLVVAAARLAVDLFREEKSRKTSGTRVQKIHLKITLCRSSDCINMEHNKKQNQCSYDFNESQ